MVFLLFHCTFHFRHSLSCISIIAITSGTRIEKGSVITPPQQSLRTQNGPDYFAVQVSKVIELPVNLQMLVTKTPITVCENVAWGNLEKDQYI